MQGNDVLANQEITLLLSLLKDSDIGTATVLYSIYTRLVLPLNGCITCRRKVRDFSAINQMRPCNGLQKDKFYLSFCWALQNAGIARHCN